MGPETPLVQGPWWVQRTLVGQGSVVGLVDLGGFRGPWWVLGVPLVQGPWWVLGPWWVQGQQISGCYSLLSHSVRTQKHVIWVNLVTAPAGEHTHAQTDRQTMNNPEETGSGEQMGLVGAVEAETHAAAW